MRDSPSRLVPEAEINRGEVVSHRSGLRVLRFVEDGIEGPGVRVTQTGPHQVHDTEAFYFGPAGTEGEWRIARSGNDLVMQRRESGKWVTKSTVAAAGA